MVNHLTFNADGSRFVALVRNFPPKGQRHHTAVVTAARDGSDLYLLSDFGIKSHYFWLNEKELAIYSDGKELVCSRGKANNYILTDQTHKGTLMAEGFFIADNHMSYSPDRRLMITDTYPDSETNHQTLRLYSPEKESCVDLGYFYSLPAESPHCRYDLHPRWNRKGNGITFDSTCEGFRGVYKIDLPDDGVEELFREENSIEA